MRENRYKHLGLLFLVLSLTIIFFGSIDGLNFLQHFPGNIIENKLNSLQIVIAIIPFLGLIFASEGVGYFLTTFFIAIWTCLTGGYQNELKNGLKENVFLLKKYYPDLPDNAFQQLIDTQFEAAFNFHWRKYHKEILNWTTRRWDVFFGNYAMIFTIAVSFVLSLLFIYIMQLGFSYVIIFIFLILLVSVSFVLHQHAKTAKKENIQMIILWLKCEPGATLSQEVKSEMPSESEYPTDGQNTHL